ncbi:hypothetical protein [Xanthomonas axonopodis]
MSPIVPENIYAVWHGNPKPQLVIADSERKGVAQINDAFEGVEFMIDLDGMARITENFKRGQSIRSIRSYLQPFTSFLFLAAEVGEPVIYLTVQAVNVDDAINYATMHFKRASFVCLSSVDEFNTFAERMMKTLEKQDIKGLLDLRGQLTAPLEADHA